MKAVLRSILLLLSFTGTQVKAQQYVDQTHDEYIPVKIYKNDFDKIERERSFSAGTSTNQANLNKSFRTNAQDNQTNIQENSYPVRASQDSINQSFGAVVAREAACQGERYLPQASCTPSRSCILTGRFPESYPRPYPSSQPTTGSAVGRIVSGVLDLFRR